MAVYVDSLIDYGWRLGPSSHMTADTLEELHEMAAKIGMKREWFQNDRDNFPHYDLVKSRRNKAVKLGAIEISGWSNMAAHNKKIQSIYGKEQS